jgi:membrane protease YdiL (CAAX protease family)
MMTLRQRYSDSLGYVAPVALGLLVTFVGVAPWVAMARLNAIVRPDIPWAAMATLVWLALYLFWLNGAGPPARWKASRRYRLRLWRPGSHAWSKDGIAVTLSLMAMIGVLTVIWILLGAPARPPDLSEYPSTALLVSVFLLTPLVAGVTEEAGFRGYMQRGLERYGSQTAIFVSALAFALIHGVHGLGTLLFLGPGIFFAGIVYGLLAHHTGSILPGMILHFLGDLAFSYFGLLGGDWRLLIVS